MTCEVIDFSSVLIRKRTGQPIMPQPGHHCPDLDADIIGCQVRIPDGRIGKVASCFDCAGTRFARIWFGSGWLTTTVAVRNLEFIGSGGGDAA